MVAGNGRKGETYANNQIRQEWSQNGMRASGKLYNSRKKKEPAMDWARKWTKDDSGNPHGNIEWG